MDLLALSDFNLVAAHGGFGKASRASGKPKATLSRRVMELEEALGVRLLDRGSRSLKLTEEGRNLFARTEGLLREVGEAGAAISAGLDHPRGPLRVSAPVLFAHVALGRIAAEFASAYPDVRLEITAEDRVVDPVEEGYDVVIRINPSHDDRLVGRCFLRDELVVVAPRSVIRPPYVAGKSLPVRAVVLSSTAQGAIWRVPNGQQTESLLPDPVLRLSSLLMVREAVLAGAGLLPRFMIAGDVEAGRLACWGVIEDRPVAIWALHSSRRLVSSKVAAFLRCLVDAFPDRSL
jgi:DNA-binding transcriptional LysR family regulator